MATWHKPLNYKSLIAETPGIFFFSKAGIFHSQPGCRQDSLLPTAYDLQLMTYDLRLTTLITYNLNAGLNCLAIAS